MGNDTDSQGWIATLKDSVLLWLLVPILIPAVSFVIFVVAWLVGDKNHDSIFSNIDLMNSFLVFLVVLFLFSIAAGDKLAWVFFRKRVSKGQLSDPSLQIRKLRVQLARNARIIRDSDIASKWFNEETSKIKRKEQFRLAMGRCLDSVKQIDRDFRINNFDLWERCTLPASTERIKIDFSLVGALLASIQDSLSQLTLHRCVMIQRIYHRPELLTPFQDMCDLFESMSDQREKDSHNATNDNHPEQFSENYTDEKRAAALAGRFANGLAKAMRKTVEEGAAKPVRALFVGCGWENLVSGVVERVKNMGIPVEWTFADVNPDSRMSVANPNTVGDVFDSVILLTPPFTGSLGAFAQWKNRYDAVLYAHCLQHSAKSCRNDVFTALLRCVRPGGVAMLAMATSPDPTLDGCAVEGLASYETIELLGKEKAEFVKWMCQGAKEFDLVIPLRGQEQLFSVRFDGPGVWAVECNHQNKGHILKICDKVFFYRHREAGNVEDGRLLCSLVVNDPMDDSKRSRAFADYAIRKLMQIGTPLHVTVPTQRRDIVFVKGGNSAILTLSAGVFRAGTGTTPQKRDIDRYFCFLCSNVGETSRFPEFDQSNYVCVSIDGIADSGVQLAFVRPKDSMDPTKEQMLFILEANCLWRTFLPKTCQFPLNLFEKKPTEWLSRYASEFEPFGIIATFDPPTITRRMSHETRMKLFHEAGYGEIEEYYHQILAIIPHGKTFPGVPGDCDLSGWSDVERDIRFNTLPINIRLQLLDVLNVQDVLVWGTRLDVLSKEPNT